MKKNLLNLAGVLATRIAGSSAHFITSILIAKLLSPSDAGILFIGISFTVIFATFARFGLDNLILKRAAILYAQNNWSDIQRNLKMGIKIALGLSLGLILLFNFANIPSLVLSEGGKTEHKVVSTMFLATPFFAIFFLYSAVFKAINRATIASMIESAAWPVLFCISIAILFFVNKLNTYSLGWVFTTNSILIAGFSFLALRHFATPNGPRTSSENLTASSMLTESWALMGLAVCHVLLRWSDTIWVSSYLGNSDTGIYTVSSRLSSIFSFFSAAATAVIAPKFAVYYDRGDIPRIFRIFYGSIAGLFILLTPILLILVSYSNEILSLISSQYLAGSRTLQISLILQFLHAVTIPVGYLVIMTGMEKSYFYLMLVSMTISQALYFFLIPEFGIEGAAIASGTPTILLHIILIALTSRKLKSRKSKKTNSSQDDFI